MSSTLRGARGKVTVGYPVGGSVTLGFHASMLRLLAYEYSKGDRRLLARINHTQGLYVSDNRTLLAQQFMKTQADWLLQVDTDIEFPPTLIEDMVRLAGDDKLILAASVPLGAYPSCGWMRTDTPGVWSSLLTVPRVPVEVDGIATAVVLIHREAFARIADLGGQCWFHHVYLPASPVGTAPADVRFHSQGEDLAFSVRAAAAGVSQWVVHVPGLRHLKTRGLSHDDEAAALVRHADGGVGELVEDANAMA